MSALSSLKRIMLNNYDINRTWMDEKSLVDIKLGKKIVDRLRETRTQNPV